MLLYFLKDKECEDKCREEVEEKYMKEIQTLPGKKETQNRTNV